MAAAKLTPYFTGFSSEI